MRVKVRGVYIGGLSYLERVEMRGEVEIDGLPERLGARVVTVFSEDKILQWAGEWKEIGMLKSMREKERESRLIDAEKLKRHYAWWEGGSAEKTLDEAKKDFDEIVDLQPTAEITFEADVVKVVRCRECKYREDEQPSMVYCPCMVGGWVDENWFCAGGVRNE